MKGGGSSLKVESMLRWRRLSVALCVLSLAPAAFADRSVDSKRAASDKAADGSSEPTPTRIWSREKTTWIYDKPRQGHWRERLGYIRLGTSVELRSAEPVRGAGCPKGFYRVEPRGYVCLDRTSALSGSSRYLRGMQLAAPLAGTLPFHYALSNGAPMYRRLPTRAEWQREERSMGKAGTFGKLSWGNRGHEKLAEVRVVKARDKLPWFLADGGSISHAHEKKLVRRVIPLGSTLAYTKSFKHDGRTWLLSADGTVVPADRVRPYRESSFHGVHLGGAVKLPIAWMRASAKPTYIRDGHGAFHAAGQSWAVRTFVGLASATAEKGGRQSYLPTRARDDQGQRLWILESDATVVKQRDRLPYGVGKTDKWLVVSITHGTLVAYVGLRPVFSTLVSPGAGGPPRKGVPPLKTSSSPMGHFRIQFKHRAAIMSPDAKEPRRFWIADVPDTQYFDPPYALHTAYWHESFGEPMSAGCINLSPRDGRTLFKWTDPKLPPGWNGVQAGGAMGKGTFVAIER